MITRNHSPHHRDDPSSAAVKGSSANRMAKYDGPAILSTT